VFALNDCLSETSPPATTFAFTEGGNVCLGTRRALAAADAARCVRSDIVHLVCTVHDSVVSLPGHPGCYVDLCGNLFADSVSNVIHSIILLWNLQNHIVRQSEH
jgi:hypothetical protein